MADLQLLRELRLKEEEETIKLLKQAALSGKDFYLAWTKYAKARDQYLTALNSIIIDCS